MLSQSIIEIFRFTDANGISPIVLFAKKKVNSCLRYVITVTGCNFNTRDFNGFTVPVREFCCNNAVCSTVHKEQFN